MPSASVAPADGMQSPGGNFPPLGLFFAADGGIPGSLMGAVNGKKGTEKGQEATPHQERAVFDKSGMGPRVVLSGLARASAAFSPVDVISPIKGDDHQARGLALAGELMRHVAPHHGKSAWREPCGLMIGHLGQDGAADDDQLLFGRMEMPRNHASG